MVKVIEASLFIWGETLSPAAIEAATGLTFDSVLKREPGPRYKGTARLSVPVEMKSEDKLVWLLDAIQPYADTIRQLGATDGCLHITYGYALAPHCSLFFTPALLERIATVGFDFSIHCYEAPLAPLSPW